MGKNRGRGTEYAYGGGDGGPEDRTDNRSGDHPAEESPPITETTTSEKWRQIIQKLKRQQTFWEME